jgi:hypothetical protein
LGGKGEDKGEIEAEILKAPEFAGQSHEQRGSGLAPDDAQGMGREGDDNRGQGGGAGFFKGAAEKSLVSEMNAVEVADGSGASAGKDAGGKGEVVRIGGDAHDVRGVGIFEAG